MPKVGPFTVTTKGTKAKFSEGDGDGDDPTQEDLQKLAEKHRDTLKELDMDMEGSADFDLTIDAEVSVGCLPKLKVLKLVGTDISKMRITKEVFPALESLELQGFETPLEEFYLDLPNLKELHVQHLEIEPSQDNMNCLGDSLTRCPKLQALSTYKFVYCHGFNFMVLPEMREMHLQRAEGLNALEILDAPKLQMINVQAAYELGRIRLYDFPAAKGEDALQFSAEWKARKSSKGAKAFAERYKKYLADMEEKSKASKRKLPMCIINRENIQLPKWLKKELMEHKRVQLVGEGIGMSDEDDEDDGNPDDEDDAVED